MPHAEPGEVFRQQAADTAEADDRDTASRKLCLTSLSKHSELAIVGVRGIEQMPRGRWRETVDRITYHDSFIKAQALAGWKPKVHLYGSSAEHHGANRHPLGNLQQRGIAAFMRFQVNATECYLPITAVIMCSQINQSLVSCARDELVDERGRKRPVANLAFDVINAFLCNVNLAHMQDNLFRGGGHTCE